MLMSQRGPTMAVALANDGIWQDFEGCMSSCKTAPAVRRTGLPLAGGLALLGRDRSDELGGDRIILMRRRRPLGRGQLGKLILSFSGRAPRPAPREEVSAPAPCPRGKQQRPRPDPEGSSSGRGPVSEGEELN